MKVRIFNLRNGLDIIDNVVAIRINSKDYNLLVLKDYVSLLGEIHGDLEIETDSDTIKYSNVNANFMNDDNIFSIIFDEEYHHD